MVRKYKRMVWSRPDIQKAYNLLEKRWEDIKKKTLREYNTPSIWLPRKHSIKNACVSQWPSNRQIQQNFTFVVLLDLFNIIWHYWLLKLTNVLYHSKRRISWLIQHTPTAVRILFLSMNFVSHSNFSLPFLV